MEERQDLYDPITRDVIENDILYNKFNKHLYSAILQCVRDEPWVLVQDMDYFWGDGVSLLRSLKNTYQGNSLSLKNSNYKANYSIPTFTFAPRMNLLTTTPPVPFACIANSFPTKIQPDILKACFICGLGPEFTDIIRQLNNHNLPREWQPIPIIQLIEPARQDLRLARQQQAHNANYKAVNKNKSNPSTNSTNTSHKQPIDKDKDHQA